MLHAWARWPQEQKRQRTARRMGDSGAGASEVQLLRELGAFP